MGSSAPAIPGAQYGAFTSLTASLIAQQIAQAGFATTGKIFYMDPLNGLDLNNGLSPRPIPGQLGSGPVQTLAGGYALLTAGENDVLVLIGNGLTTASARLSAAFTWSKDAAHFIGIAAPSRYTPQARIAPTLGATAFTPFFTLSGNGCFFSNLTFFHGFNTGTTGQINFTVTGKNNSFRGVAFQGMGDTTSAASATSRSLLVKGGENYFLNCQIGIDTIQRTALNASLELAAGSVGAARNFFENCAFPVDASTSAAGLAILVASADAIDRITVFKQCTFVNCAAFSGGAAATGVAKLVASAGGALLMQDSTEYGFTDWGYDAASKAEILVAGPVPTSSSSGIAVVNT